MNKHTCGLGLIVYLATACASVGTDAGMTSAASVRPVAQPGVARGADSHRQLALVIGSRDGSDLEPTDPHTSFGVEFSTYGASGWGWEGGVSFSDGDGSVGAPPAGPGSGDVDLELIQLSAGARYTFVDVGSIVPNVGFGVSVISWDAEADTGFGPVKADDTDFGGYVHGGADYLVSDSVSIGLDVRALLGTGDDLDYVELALMLGWIF